MGLMFPTVIMIVNVSSVAVVWFGANRVDRGELRIGALIAFLTYLMQILMAVMLATYMAALVPRAAVSAERIQEVLDTPSSVTAAEHPVAQLPPHATRSRSNASKPVPYVRKPASVALLIGRRKRSSPWSASRMRAFSARLAPSDAAER